MAFTSIKATDLYIRGVRTAAGGNGNNNRKPPVSGFKPHFELEGVDGEDTLLSDLKGLYNTCQMQSEGIQYHSAKDGMRPYEAKRYDTLRAKMQDLLACIWLLETRAGKHTD